MATFAGQYGPETADVVTGVPLKSTAFTVYLPGTVTLAALYTDRTKVQAAANPGVTSATGNLTFFADPGRYDVAVNGVTLTVSVGYDPAESLAAVTARSTDQTSDLQAAINLNPSALSLPVGQYTISAPLVFQFATGSSVPVQYPSLIGVQPPGRIGDSTDVSGVQIICSNSFPVGDPVIKVLAPNSQVAPSGMELANLGVKCNSRGSGVYIEQPRRFNVHDLQIDHPAIPAGAPNGASAAFSVVALSGTAPAYSSFRRIVTAYGAQDGFFHNCAADDVFDSCWDLNSTRFAFNAQGFARWVNCHYEASEYGWSVLSGNAMNTIIGCDLFGRPTLNALQLSSSFSSGSNNSATFIGCRFGVSPVSFQSTSVPVFLQGSAVILAEFIGCDFLAEGSTEFWIQADLAPIGSVVQFSACNFVGSVNNGAYSDAHSVLRFTDCAGINPAGAVTVAVPSSAAAVAAAAYDRTFYVTAAAGGTTTMTIQNGPAVVISASALGTVRVPAGKTVTPTYGGGNAPTWVVEGE